MPDASAAPAAAHEANEVGKASSNTAAPARSADKGPAPSATKASPGDPSDGPSSHVGAFASKTPADQGKESPVGAAMAAAETSATTQPGVPAQAIPEPTPSSAASEKAAATKTSSPDAAEASHAAAPSESAAAEPASPVPASQAKSDAADALKVAIAESYKSASASSQPEPAAAAGAASESSTLAAPGARSDEPAPSSEGPSTSSTGQAPAVAAPAGLSKGAPKLPPRKALPTATSNAKGGTDTSSGSPASSAGAPASTSAAAAVLSTGSGSGSGSGSAAGAANAVVPAPKPAKSSFMPSLPPRQVASGGPVLDPDEPEPLQQLRRDIHAIRVSLIRAAQRLGYDHENALVKQVLYRLNLAEKLKAPWRRGKRLDPALAAAREAARLEQEQGVAAPLGFTVKMMLIGLTGAGKTQLIHSLLSSSGIGHHGPGAASETTSQDDRPLLVDPFEGATKKVQVVEGTVHGMRIVCVDTPGLVASAAATGYNSKVLQQIRSAYRRHKPDLVVYVDRLDQSAGGGGELPALRTLSENLGPGFWLNTIVALSHAGSPPPCGARGPMQFDTYANQRSHILQQVIRSASGDNRLMNPTAFVDSHPNCALNAAGQAIIVNGMPWKAHLYLMIVSAKLLADTESMLQMQDGCKPAANANNAAAANAAAMQQLMGGPGPRQLPLPYLVSTLTQFTRPMKYPDHDLVMDTRRMEKAAGGTQDEKQARGLVRQVKARLLQLRQAHANKERMQRSFRNATLAGGKVTPEPPRLATKRAPSVHPPVTFRYRVPEPTDGWIVRPHIEVHGMDHSDGIEGLYLEKVAVAGRKLQDKGKDKDKDRDKDTSKDKADKKGEGRSSRPPVAAAGKAGTSGTDSSTPGRTGGGGQAVVERPVTGAAVGAGKAAGTGAALDVEPGVVAVLDGAPLVDPLAETAVGPGTKHDVKPHPGHDAKHGAKAGTKGAMQEKAMPDGRRKKQRKQKVGRSDADNLLGGIPYRHYVSAQVGKEHQAIQVRSEASLYHDPLGTSTSTLSMDIQTSGGGMGMPLDALCTLRADMRRKGVLGQNGKATIGLLAARVAEGLRPYRGPAAVGARIQQVVAAPLPGTSHSKLQAVAAYASTLPGGVGSPEAMLAEREGCFGANLELLADLQPMARTSQSLPLTLGLNAVRYRNELMTGLAAALQYQTSRSEQIGGRLQAGSKGKGGLSVKVKSREHFWAGLVAMAVPLGTMLLQQVGLIR